MKRYGIFILVIMIGMMLACGGFGKRSKTTTHPPKSYTQKPGKPKKIKEREVPPEPKYHYGLGCELFRDGKLLEAKAEFQKAIAGWPAYPEALNAYGRILEKLGRPVDAVYYYLLSIEFNPNIALTYYNLGEVSRALGDDYAAIKYYQQATSLVENPAYINAMGFAYRSLANKSEKDVDKMKNTKQAINSFEWATGIEEKNTEAWRNLVELYYTVGKYESCSEAIKKYKKLGGSVPFELEEKVKDKTRAPE